MNANHKLSQRYQADGMAVMPRPQLVVRLYERLLADLQGGVVAVTGGLIEEAHRLLIHAQDIVHELALALDHDQWDGGYALRSLYSHLGVRLVDANTQKSALVIQECIDIVAPLVEAWQQALVSSAAERVVPVAAGSGHSYRV